MDDKIDLAGFLPNGPSTTSLIRWKVVFDRPTTPFPGSTMKPILPRGAQVKQATLIDAGMRELNTAGFMHNRVRMVVASFLCKHLLTDWRWGRRYFAAKALDLASPQQRGRMAVGFGIGLRCGTVFPRIRSLRSSRNSARLRYVRKWVSRIQDLCLPKPSIKHKSARQRAIDTYQSVLKPSA